MSSYWNPRVEFSTLLGRTLTGVRQVDDEAIVFACSDGAEYSLCHVQDCCESVRIEDINGDLQSLVGSPILIAEEVASNSVPGPVNQWDESYTWTFYKLATINGHVDIRWYGTSNGYYSESVDLREMKKPLAPPTTGGDNEGA